MQAHLRQANPGGLLDPKDVVGRDALIASIWRALTRQSVVLTAERRMGKTSILRKMEKQPQQGWLVKFRDLESVQTPADFVALVHEDVAAHLSHGQRITHRFKAALKDLGGAELGGLLKLPAVAESHWKRLLGHLIEDLCDQQEERRLVFFWDEVPLMLHNIRTRMGEPAAMELLDALRALRQSHPSLRMVFTGSIGLHNVLTTLRRAGYANAPTNDMRTLDVPALAEKDAVQLAVDLLQGEGLKTQDPEITGHAIAYQVSNIPFLIHAVVSRLVDQGHSVIGREHIASLVTQCLTDPQDPWHLAYYHDRIRTYYTPEEQAITWPVLDALARAEGPLSLSELQGLLVSAEGEALRQVLGQVQRDHYVSQEEDGRYRYRFPIIQRHFRLYRGLTG